LGYENGVADTIDPLAGSYYVEKLTDTIEAEAKAYIAKIDNMGGALTAIEQGFPQREINESAYRYQKAVEAGDRVVVGVNKFVSTYAKLPLLRLDPAVAKKQIGRLQKVKSERDNAATKKALDNLKKVAQGTDNTMPAIIECAAAYATIGEICDVLRGVFGEQREFAAF
jgi:methylmalonyl-CoA mutase N-terminal domain/subunit